MPRENFSLHKSDCPGVALSKDGRVPGGASAGDLMGPEGKQDSSIANAIEGHRVPRTADPENPALLVTSHHSQV